MTIVEKIFSVDKMPVRSCMGADAATVAQSLKLSRPPIHGEPLAF
jgi:hypothetical protein